MGGRRLDVRTWAILVAFTVVCVLVAVIATRPTTRAPIDVDVAGAVAALTQVPVLPERARPGGYDRAAFGSAWADSSDAQDAGNGCDTRNDVLDRDLHDKTYVAVASCPRAVQTGELRSPYSGEWIDFRRGRTGGAAIQIDHIVPLAYAWDMGASRWDPALRLRFANDPGNLVAVDGPSNQDKSDSPPSVWMPRRTAFACQYAVQFIRVVSTYRLAVDAPSVPVLRRSLRRC
ncbi:HNH endonuclease family protein [Williamsia phyllosphaerae]|uniref:Membrane protein n=1 Tax=Williamsia phyllosphaerae TaxID=885042 RepID=A0ABQ1UY33_9NOCA|nr:HNH endonuclease family protein [Williamsia phyllosphaerae]GGF28064.1 membrane protein [Williamsia phyllosphaerae]